MRTSAKAFTLVELMVVISLIGVLLALLIPAVSAARESSRRAQCMNNMKQLGTALVAEGTTIGSLPPRYSTLPCMQDGRPLWTLHEVPYRWSTLVHLVKYFDQPTADIIPWEDGWRLPLDTGEHFTVYRPPEFMCPSANDLEVESIGGFPNRPTSYAICMGTWLCRSHEAAEQTPLITVKRARLEDVRDGLSNTLAFAEVTPGLDFTESRLLSPPELPIPDSAKSLNRYTIFRVNTGRSHSEWVSGRVVHTGFTTTFRPNTKIPSGVSDDRNWINMDIRRIKLEEECCKAEYCPPFPRYLAPAYAVPSRSLHSGLVQIVMADSSVRAINDGIDLKTWRALTTRAGSKHERIRSTASLRN